MDTHKTKTAKYLYEYKLKVTFEDGRSGIIDLSDQLWGEVFEPLKDTEKFKDFHIDHELSTMVWPTGADFAPEFLYKECA